MISRGKGSGIRDLLESDLEDGELAGLGREHVAQHHRRPERQRVHVLFAV